MKRIGLFTFLWLAGAAAPAWAADITLTQQEGKWQLQLPVGQAPLAVFQRFEDVWVVTSDPQTPLNFQADKPTREKADVQESENLQVSGGAGVRIRFKAVPGVQVQNIKGGYIATLQKPTAPVTADLKLNITADHALVSHKEQGNMVRATSFATRESYVVLPLKTVAGENTGQIKGQVRILPSAMGGVFVSAEGLPIGFQEEKGQFKLTQMTDPTSVAVARNNKAALSILDDVFGAVQNPAVEAVAQPQEARPKISYEVNLPVGKPNASASFNQAYSQLEGALKTIDGLKLPQKAEPQPAPETITPPVMAEMPAGVMPTALPELAFLTNFADSSPVQLKRLEQRLVDRIVNGKEAAEREAATLRLANLFLFRQHYPEAYGLLGTLPEDPTLKWPQNADARLLQAVAQVMMGHAKLAQDLLDSVQAPSLDKQVWLAATNTLLGDHAKAVSLFADSIDHVGKYPPAYAQQLKYFYALSLFKLGRQTAAMDQIDQLSSLGGDSPVLPYAQLLMGRIYEARNDDAVAEQIFVSLSSNPNQIVANEALFYFLGLLEKKGELKDDAAALRYENLRYMWRGDDVEEETLFRLGQIYEQEHRFRDALERYKYLSAHFPTSTRAAEATDHMTKIFSDLFIKGQADASLDALGLLGLYYEFRELTPPGPEGDLLIRKITDRLVALDLFKRAITTLEQQLKYRLKDPAQKAEAGLRLAQLYRMDFNPKEGLAVLDRTNAPNIPKSLVDDRLHERIQLALQARDTDMVRQLLTNMTGDEADYLRAMLAWEDDNYLEVAHILVPKFQGTGGRDWTPEQRDAFLRLCMAMSVLTRGDDIAKMAIRYKDGIIVNNLQPEMQFLVQNAGGVTDPGLLEDPIFKQNLEGPWGRMVKALDDYNKFRDDYAELKNKWEEERNPMLRPPRL